MYPPGLISVCMSSCIGQDKANHVGCPNLFQGKYKEAELLHRRAMDISETTLGTEHETYAACLSSLAGLLKHQVGARAPSCVEYDYLQLCVYLYALENPRHLLGSISG